MKKLLLTTATAALIAAGANAAYATDQNIVISATVTAFCKIDGSETPAPDNATIATLTGNVVLGPINKTYAVLCNKAANTQLTSQSGGLIGPAAAAGFENVINYSASTTGFVANPGGSTATNGATGAPEPLGAAVASGGPAAANIVVAISPIANTDPLVAGAYSDTLTLAINPTP